MQEYISQKKNIIAENPFSYGFLKAPFSSYKIRRFKSGKVRILYVVHKENPDFWKNKQPSSDKDVLFLFVGLRNPQTYEIAYKLLRKEFNFFK